MFCKVPLKTYQRKKGGGACTTINQSSIIREDKNLQPKDFLPLKDTNTFLEFDPFDTTFDRIARDVKMPPIPPNPDDDSYTSSSNDANNTSLDDSDFGPLPDPLPIINPKPLRRNLKKIKLDKNVSTVKMEFRTKTRRRRYQTDSSVDENGEPNFGQKSRKRKKNIKDSKMLNNVAEKKKSRLVEKPVVSNYRNGKDKNLDEPQNFKQCSVRLMRVDNSSNKSTADFNLTNNVSNYENTADKIVVSYPNKKENVETLDKKPSINLGEENTSILKNPTSKKLVENQKQSLKEEKNLNTFKNPTVSLTRLNIPKPRAAVANKLWLNSTPMTTTTIRSKSLLHISPIATDYSIKTTDYNEGDSYGSQNLLFAKPNVRLTYLTPKKLKSSTLLTQNNNVPISTDISMGTTHRNEDDSYEGQNLSSGKPNVESKNLTPKKLKPSRILTQNNNVPISTDISMGTTDRNEDDNYEGQDSSSGKSNVQSKNLTAEKSMASRFSNRTEKSETKSKLLLSASPDPEPSGLMFEDTEIIATSADSYASVEESGQKNATQASTMNPLMDFSKTSSEVVVAEQRPALRSVLAPIANYNNTMEASATSTFKSFTKNSTDSESLHLTFDESDKIETTSKEVTRSIEKARIYSSTSEENQGSKIKETTDAVTFRGLEKGQKKILKIRLSRLAEGAINLQNRSKDSTEYPKNSSDVSSKDPNKTSQKSTKVLKNDYEASIQILENSLEKMTEVLLSNSIESTEVLQSSLDKNTEVLQNSSIESVKDLLDSSNESAKNRQSSLDESAEDWQDSSMEKTEDVPTRLNSKDDSIDLQTRLNEIHKNRQRSSKKNSENRQTSSYENQENPPSILDLSAYDTTNISKEIAKDWESSLDERSLHATDQINSDDEWETTNESPKSNLSSVRSSENIRTQRTDGKSIMHVNSEEGNTFCDDDVEFDNASQSFSQTENDSQTQYENEPESDNQTQYDNEPESDSQTEHDNEPKSDSQTEHDNEPKSDSQTEHDNEPESDNQTQYDNEPESDSQTEYDNKPESDSQTQYDNEPESDSQTEHDHRQELSSFEVDESAKIETFSKSKTKVDNLSIVEITYDKKLIKNIRQNSLQPIVLLSRCNVPIRSSKKISQNINSRLEKSNDSMKFINDLSSGNEDDDIGKLINQSLVSESIEWNNETEESQETPGDMTSLRVEELSENGAAIEEPTITEVSDRDSSSSSLRWSITKVRNASESSSEKMEVNKCNEEENFAVAEVSMKKSVVNENPVKKLAKDSFEDNDPPIQPIVLLNRLNDSVRVGDRRKKYRNWDLTAISEDVTVQNVTTIDEKSENFATADTLKNQTNTDEINNESMIHLSGNSKTVISQETTISYDVSVLSNQSNASIREDKAVFLKPGKSWSRSLSLYRQVHSQNDVESLAFGKGKKWRQSVQAVLDMQQQGVIQSCVKKNADDKESRSCYGVRNSAAAWIPGSSQPNPTTIFSQTSVGSPGRFIRRISIRVVPDCKNSELYEDSPFLEAYGITSSENRKTIDKRSTLIAPRKSLVYNVKYADVSFENIPKRLSNVTSRDVVLAQCGQETSVSFEEFYPDSYLKYCRKIGEGVFGEVFLYEKGPVKNVIKIIPIEGELKVNGERQKKFDEILSEIVIAKELNNLRFSDTCKTSSFVEVKNIRCVAGNYPPMLIDLWNTFDNEKHSENDCPEMFDKDQLYIVLELGHGGQDLEAFVFQNSSEAHALFIQTALALAVAEEALEFEHRDLHWGNILISRTEDSQIIYKLRDKDIKVASKGVKVSVIDFTLSRMSYQGCSIFNDLSLDDDLFAAQGEYQFEIYRLMRQKVENNWQTFEPFTNILWLHYTLDKMITAVRYRRTSSKIHRSGIEQLIVLKNEILDYTSAFDFVTNCDNVTRLQESCSNGSTIS